MSAEKPGDDTATIEQLLANGWQVTHDGNTIYIFNPNWVHRYPVEWPFAEPGDRYEATLIEYREYTGGDRRHQGVSIEGLPEVPPPGLAE